METKQKKRNCHFSLEAEENHDNKIHFLSVFHFNVQIRKRVYQKISSLSMHSWEILYQEQCSAVVQGTRYTCSSTSTTTRLTYSSLLLFFQLIIIINQATRDLSRLLLCVRFNSLHSITIIINNAMRKSRIKAANQFYCLHKIAILLLVYLLPSLFIQLEIRAEATTAKDLYSTLSVPKTASQKDITKAYRKLALKYHPDKVSPVEREAAEKKFKEIGHAHDVLSDESKRKMYDMYGEQGLDPNFHPGMASGATFGGNDAAGSGSFGGININDLFQMGQGGPNRRFTSYSNSGMDGGDGVHIDFSEILQSFMMDGMNGQPSPAKSRGGGFFGNTMGNMGGGMGWTGNHMNNNMNMNGHPRYSQSQQQQRQQPPPRYDNKSKPKIQQFYCSLSELSNSNGCTKNLKVTGEGGHEKLYSIKVQPGWKDGTKIKFKATKDGLFPPITFVLREKKHKYLTRDGDNLIFHCTVTARQAKNGAKITVPLPDGEVLEIQTSPNEITKGYEKEIIGKGMPRRKSVNKSHDNVCRSMNSNDSRGDLIVEFRIKEES